MKIEITPKMMLEPGLGHRPYPIKFSNKYFQVFNKIYRDISEFLQILTNFTFFDDLS